MLQPLQLKEVSVRYAEEIAELRDFLTKTGLPIETEDALAATAARLPHDRAFHRDLTSFIWVLIDNRDHHISYSDLLGILAIAAAGPRLAATADETATHQLLRFLMEAKRSFDTPTPQNSVNSTTMPGAPSSAAMPQAATAKVGDETPQISTISTGEELAAASPSERRDLRWNTHPTTETPGREINKRIVWPAAAILLAALLGTGLWLHNRQTTNNPALITTAPETTSAPSPQTATNIDSQPDNQQATPTEETAPPPAEPRNAKTTRHGRSKTKSFKPAPIFRTPAITAATPAPITRPAAVQPPATNARIPTPGATSSASAPQETMAKVGSIPSKPNAPSSSATPQTQPTKASSKKTSAPTAVPSAALAKRMDSPPQPDYPASEYDAHGRRYPRLLRRYPANSSNPTDQDLVASNHPPATPSGAANSNTGNTPLPSGTVRPASLGMMAANVLYSPAPAYPAEALAAHIQGEVRVQAQVDRDGNVASVRIISGPPQLRAAAQDAVQRWRYRPYISRGKPMSTSADAIVDFQLQ